ncbi:MAG: alpha-L-fucosidase [Bacteroidota bacterium]|jgi:alpha-L-fucosidase
MRSLICIFISLILLAGSIATAQPGCNYAVIPKGVPIDSVIKIAASVKPDQRQAAWQEMEFTVFFHFGINTFADLEWGKKGTKPGIFNPSELDARQWVRTAKEAGAKLAILVAKHHDGFCNWPSKYTDYSVKNSPWKNGQGDVVKEVSDACREYGLKFGLYVSPWDIHSEVYGSDAYNTYFKNLLTEVLTNYGEVSEVWFDGACGEGPNGKKQVYDWTGYYELIRKLQPKAVIAIMGPDVRWVGTESGYGRETEWSVVPLTQASLESISVNSQHKAGKGIFLPPGDMMQEDLGSRETIRNAPGLIWYPSEVDVSIRPGWFYHGKDDSLVKSPEKLADIYFSSVGRNSVLLLNLPPDKRGLIHENDIKSLRGMRALLDSCFSENVAAGATIIPANGNLKSKGENMTDHNPSTYWTCRKGSTCASFIMELKKISPFNCLSIQENIKNGQRVESFLVEIPDGKAWKVIASGTTIGYKRLLRFPRLQAGMVRIRITSSRQNPEISEIGLFLIPERLIPVNSQ